MDPGASTEEQDPEEGRRRRERDGGGRGREGEREINFAIIVLYHTSIKLCTQTNNNSCIHAGVNTPPLPKYRS